MVPVTIAKAADDAGGRFSGGNGLGLARKVEPLLHGGALGDALELALDEVRKTDAFAGGARLEE